MNNDTVICKKCGAEMSYIKEGHSVSWICKNCGDAVATSFFEPYETDLTEYHIWICSSFKASTDRIKMISEIANCNFLEAKKMIENAPIEIFCGTAVDVKAIKEKLEAAGIEFSIEPDFPY